MQTCEKELLVQTFPLGVNLQIRNPLTITSKSRRGCQGETEYSKDLSSSISLPAFSPLHSLEVNLPVKSESSWLKKRWSRNGPPLLIGRLSLPEYMFPLAAQEFGLRLTRERVRSELELINKTRSSYAWSIPAIFTPLERESSS